MIETIINEPLNLPSNASPVTFDETDIRTRCATCNCNGWLDYSNGNPNFKIFGNGYTGYYDVEFSATVSTADANISVQSVPSVPTPTTPTTPISTTQAIITNATFSISRI